MPVRPCWHCSSSCRCATVGLAAYMVIYMVKCISSVCAFLQCVHLSRTHRTWPFVPVGTPPLQVHLLQELQQPTAPSPLPPPLLDQAAAVWRGVAARQVTVSKFHTEVAATLTQLGACVGLLIGALCCIVARLLIGALCCLLWWYRCNSFVQHLYCLLWWYRCEGCCTTPGIYHCAHRLLPGAHNHCQ